MPMDAKLGFLAGVILVVAVALVFYRKDADVTGAATTVVSAAPTAPAAATSEKDQQSATSNPPAAAAPGQLTSQNRTETP